MAAKSLPPFQIFTNADMSQASQSSKVSDIRNIDNVAVELVWTGTPTGTFAVNGSIDYGINGAAATWVPLTLNPAPAASGSASSALVNMNGLAFAYIQVVYTKTSGTGTLNGYISGKGV